MSRPMTKISCVLTAGFAMLAAYVSPIKAQGYITEVFIGNDTGIGLSGMHFDTEEGQNELSFPLEGLRCGAHLVSFRVMDEQGRCTPTISRLIYVSEAASIQGAEYFIDEDPGIGNAISIPVTSSGTFAFYMPTDALSVGSHTLTVRTLGASGLWGGGMSRVFLVTANGVEVEWFFDEDPGYGNGNSFAGENGENVILLPTEGLSAGTHLLSVRSRDSKGRWSATVTHPLYVAQAIEDIVRGEFFVDEDPGEGNATGFDLDAAGSGSFAVTTSKLSEGLHYLTLRGCTEQGDWQPLHVAPFEVTTIDGICAVQWRMGVSVRRVGRLLTLGSSEIENGTKVEVFNVSGVCIHRGVWADTHREYTVEMTETRDIIVVITAPSGLRTIKRIS